MDTLESIISLLKEFFFILYSFENPLIPETYFFFVLFVPATIIIIFACLYLAIGIATTVIGYALMSILGLEYSWQSWILLIIFITAVFSIFHLYQRYWTQERAIIKGIGMLRAEDSRRFGAKSTNLGIMKKANFLVAPGFVVDGALFEKYLGFDGSRQFHEKVNHCIEEKSPDANRLLIKQTSLLVEKGKFPIISIIWLWLHYIYLRFFGMGENLIVRSSFNMEDSRNESFAGIFTTVKSVANFKQMLDAMIKCWKSAQTPEFLKYIKNHGLQNMEITHSLLIQKELKGDFIGTCFTIDPILNKREFMVLDILKSKNEKYEEAGSYKVSRLDYSIQSLAKDTGFDFPFHTRRIVHLFSMIEARLGVPADIEWLFQEGKFFILQARPITGINPGKTYARDNRLQTVSYPFSRLTISLIISKNTPANLLTLPYKNFLKNDISEDIVKIIDGRFYISLLDLNSMELQMHLSLGQIAKYIRMLFRHYYHGEYFLRELERINAELDLKELASVEPIEIPEEINRLNRILNGRGLDMQVTTQFILENWVMHTKTFMRKLQIPESLLTSSMSFHELSHHKKERILAQEIEKGIKSIGISNFEQITSEQLAERLNEMVSHGLIPRKTSEYKCYFGHLGEREFEISSERVGDNMELLATRLKSVINKHLYKSRAEREWEVKKTIPRTSLLAWDRIVLKVLLAYIHKYFTLREEMRFHLIKLNYHIKKLALIYGDYLVQNQILDNPEDVFFMDLGELLYRDIKQIKKRTVQKNKQRYLQYMKIEENRILQWENKKQDFEVVGKALDENRKIFEYESYPKPDHGQEGLEEPLGGKIYTGIKCVSGQARGNAVFITKKCNTFYISTKDILIIKEPLPWYSIYLPEIGGIVAERGNPLSHLCIIAREYGIPTVVGVGDAIRELNNGQYLLVDGTKGLVQTL